MIEVGVIGWGYWGPHLGRNIGASGASRLAAVADHSPARRHDAALAHPGVGLWPSGEELLADPRIDAVVLATPAHTHFALASAALAAGKHVLVEKPLTDSAEPAQILVNESRRRGLVLMVDHTFVYSPAVRAIRERLDSGVLGVPRYYDSSRLNLGIVRRDVNVLWDVASHDLAILDYLMPWFPVAVQAAGIAPAQGDMEPQAWLTLTYPDGFLAHLNASWLSPAKIRRIVIGGSERTLVYDDMNRVSPVTVFEGADAIEAPSLEPGEPLLAMVREFVSCIESGAAPLTDGAAGLRVVRLLEAADTSMRDGGRIVELDTEGVPA